MNRFLVELRRKLLLIPDGIGRRFQNRFYIFVAVLLTVAAAVDFFTTHMIVGMRNKSFDAMVNARFMVAKPSQDIIIVDIDEKTLAAMAPEFGRWPWPRQVFGEFVEKINEQKPSAVVFDIMFSDPDIYNAESDAYFDEVISKTYNTWFPMIRLAASADTASRLNAGLIPGAHPAGVIDTSAKIAVIIPFFKSVQESGRLGFNNIVPDPDGVSREYPVLYKESGYELPSLPLAVARGLGSTAHVPDRMLINWRGKPFTYKYISFADVYSDMRIEKSVRSWNEFTGKIVIIGSTAPGLFDIKVTAPDRQFPGVEILATAIDNLRSGDWLRVPDIPYVYLLVTLAILWITAAAFYRRGSGGQLDQFYGVSQFILIAIAYTAINMFCVYINLTGPVMFGFVYYSTARLYSIATARVLDKSVVMKEALTSDTRGFVLMLRFCMPLREDVLITRLSKILIAKCTCQPSAEIICGHQKGMWRFFENTMLLCWSADENNHELVEKIRNEIVKIKSIIPDMLKSKPLDGTLPHDGLIVNNTEGLIGRGKQCDWMILLAKTIMPENYGDNA